MGIKQYIVSPLLLLGVVFLLGGIAAAQSASPGYRVDEVFFGSGGELEACSESGEYCARQSAGELAVGSTSSGAYSAQVGFNSTDEPLLEVAVNGMVNFGVLEFDQTRSGSANVQVRTYLASGYTMVINGASPTNGGHALATPAVPTASQTGTEQFGLNLRANTTPVVGADPVQVPDDTFSFGVPSASYNIPNYFMYQSGDTVAYSNRSSGQTSYTLSMIANSSELTPGGIYATTLNVVVTATF